MHLQLAPLDLILKGCSELTYQGDSRLETLQAMIQLMMCLVYSNTMAKIHCRRVEKHAKKPTKPHRM